MRDFKDIKPFNTFSLKRSFVSALPLMFSLLTMFCSERKDKAGLIVGIQPLGTVDAEVIDTVASALQSAYGARIHVLPERQMPKTAFINVKTPRYRADKLIRMLRDEKPDSLDHILALTQTDISVTRTDAAGQTQKPESKYTDWGVFGYGYRPGASCIVSTQRLKTPDKTKLMLRLKKVAIHEIGHNLGLDHCTSSRCVMRDAAETIRTIDTVEATLCDQCSKRIRYSFGQ